MLLNTDLILKNLHVNSMWKLRLLEMLIYWVHHIYHWCLLLTSCYNCPLLGHVQEIDIPWSVSFLWTLHGRFFFFRGDILRVRDVYYSNREALTLILDLLIHNLAAALLLLLKYLLFLGMKEQVNSIRRLAFWGSRLKNCPGSPHSWGPPKAPPLPTLVLYYHSSVIVFSSMTHLIL